MGRRIDAIVLGGALIAAAFVFFLWSTNSILPAALMTVAAAFFGRKIYSRYAAASSGRRAHRRYADEKLSEWVLSGGSFLAEASALVLEASGLPPGPVGTDGVYKREGNGADLRFIADRRVPGARALDQNDILSVRDHFPGNETIVILTTSRLAGEVRAFAASLAGPAVKVIGEDALRRLLVAQKKLPSSPASARRAGLFRRIGRRFRAIASMVRPSTYVKYGVIMLILYIAMGVVGYLPAALILITAALLRMRGRGAPRREELL